MGSKRFGKFAHAAFFIGSSSPKKQLAARSYNTLQLQSTFTSRQNIRVSSAQIKFYSTTDKQSFEQVKMGQDIDGKSIAQAIRNEVKEAVNELKEKEGKTPGLAVILVGARRDSQTYVRMKKRACDECDIASFGFDYPDTVPQEELLGKVAELNADPAVHGILVQLPL